MAEFVSMSQMVPSQTKKSLILIMIGLHLENYRLYVLTMPIPHYMKSL